MRNYLYLCLHDSHPGAEANGVKLIILNKKQEKLRGSLSASRKELPSVSGEEHSSTEMRFGSAENIIASGVGSEDEERDETERGGGGRGRVNIEDCGRCGVGSTYCYQCSSCQQWYCAVCVAVKVTKNMCDASGGKHTISMSTEVVKVSSSILSEEYGASSPTTVMECERKGEGKKKKKKSGKHTEKVSAEERGYRSMSPSSPTFFPGPGTSSLLLGEEEDGCYRCGNSATPCLPCDHCNQIFCALCRSLSPIKNSCENGAGHKYMMVEESGREDSILRSTSPRILGGAEHMEGSMLSPNLGRKKQTHNGLGDSPLEEPKEEDCMRCGNTTSCRMCCRCNSFFCDLCQTMSSLKNMCPNGANHCYLLHVEKMVVRSFFAQDEEEGGDSLGSKRSSTSSSSTSSNKKALLRFKSPIPRRKKRDKERAKASSGQKKRMVSSDESESGGDTITTNADHIRSFSFNDDEELSQIDAPFRSSISGFRSPDRSLSPSILCSCVMGECSRCCRAIVECRRCSECLAIFCADCQALKLLRNPCSSGGKHLFTLERDTAPNSPVFGNIESGEGVVEKEGEGRSGSDGDSAEKSGGKGQHGSLMVMGDCGRCGESDVETLFCVQCRGLYCLSCSQLSTLKNTCQSGTRHYYLPMNKTYYQTESWSSQQSLFTSDSSSMSLVFPQQKILEDDLDTITEITNTHDLSSSNLCQKDIYPSIFDLDLYIYIYIYNIDLRICLFKPVPSLLPINFLSSSAITEQTEKRGKEGWIDRWMYR